MKYYILMVVVVSIMSGCTITSPVMTMTGSQTVIERQIVGDYQEIEKDAWVISSVNNSMDNSKNRMVRSGENETYLAMKIRELHSEKIRMYKNEGVIGEKYDGYILYIKNKKYEKNADKKDVLNIVIKEENKARNKIFVSTVKAILQKTPTQEQIAQFAREFAKEEKALSKVGDKIQNINGIWETK